MLGADGHLARGAGNTRPAFMAQLRRVRRAHGYDPAAILRHAMNQPLDERPAIPPAMLHRVSNPTQTFHGDNSVTPRAGEVSYLLRGENRKLPLLPGRRLTVKLRLSKRRHARLALGEEPVRLLFEESDLPIRHADAVPKRVNPLRERRLTLSDPPQPRAQPRWRSR